MERMTEFERIIAAIEALPNGGEGWTVEQIAEAAGTDNAMVIAAVQCIADRDGK